MRLLFQTILILAAVAAFAVWISLRSYRVFAHEELVAIVRCEATPQGTTDGFLLEMAPVLNGVQGRTERFPMRGDQWAVGGDILKWKPWLAFLGAKSVHKLTRLQSRYASLQAERTAPRTVYELGGGSGPLWRWAYRTGVRLPFVDAVYGNAVYLPSRPGRSWGIYVTHSGYFARPREDRRISSLRSQ